MLPTRRLRRSHPLSHYGSVGGATAELVAPSEAMFCAVAPEPDCCAWVVSDPTLFIAPPSGSEPPVVLSAAVEGIVWPVPVSGLALPRSDVGSMSVVSASRSGSCTAASFRMRLRFLRFAISVLLVFALFARAALRIDRHCERPEAIDGARDPCLGVRERDVRIGRDRAHLGVEAPDVVGDPGGRRVR